MSLKLYRARVDYEVDILIAAESKPTDDDFAEAAEQEINTHGLANPFVGAIRNIETLADIPKKWISCIPWGDHDAEKTCIQILDDYKPDVDPLGEQLSLTDEPG